MRTPIAVAVAVANGIVTETLPVKGSSNGDGTASLSSGGGGGDATAANQAIQITAAQTTVDLLQHGPNVEVNSLPVVIATDQVVPTNVTQIGGAAFALGAGGTANSLSITIALDQGAIQIQGAKVAASTNSPTRFLNVAANATLNVKSGAGNVFSAYCNNSNAAARYLQIHNTATVPSGGAAPVLSFMVPANSQIVIGTDFFTNEGLFFNTGIAFAFSTTRDTYTAGTASDQQTSINFI